MMMTITSCYPKLYPNRIPICSRAASHPIKPCNFSSSILPLKRNFGGFTVGFIVKSTNSSDVDVAENSRPNKDDEAEMAAEAREDSTMPQRFRNLTKQVSDPPIRWPYFLALGFLVYAWRTLLWELSNWKRAATSILQFFGYLSKLLLALIFHFIGDPITSTIRAIETTLYTLRAYYSQIVAYTPIPELSTVIILTSAILAISEASSPNSVDNQWHMLTISGLTGYFAVKGMIGDLVFWTLLFGLFSFSRFIKKRDYVSSALPVAAVLAGVGEPWVRAVFIGCFLALAVVQYSKNQPEEDKGEGLTSTTGGRRVPVPLLCAALAIGVRIAARWAGYRHLTWMVV